MYPSHVSPATRRLALVVLIALCAAASGRVGTAQGTPSIALTSGANPSWVSEPVTFTAAIQGLAQGTSVTFQVDGVAAGTVAATTHPTVGTDAFSSQSQQGPVVSVVIGDFTGDGKADIAFSTTGGVYLRKNNGNGTFASATLITSQANGELIAADFTHDGFLDLAAGGDSNRDATLLRGTGTGTFTAIRTFGTGGYIRAADFDADGWLDLAISGPAQFCCGNQIVLFDNNNGTWSQIAGLSAGGPIAVGDVNGDGRPDVVYSGNNFNSTWVASFLNQPNGNFTPGSTSFTEYDMAIADLAVADIDQDGRGDIVALTRRTSFNAGTTDQLIEYSGQANGTFVRNSIDLPTSLNNSTPTYEALALTDLDGDGALDVAVTADNNNCCALPSSLLYLNATGGGTFAAPLVRSVERGVNDVAAGDLDGDGVPDFVVAVSGQSPGLAIFTSIDDVQAAFTTSSLTTGVHSIRAIAGATQSNVVSQQVQQGSLTPTFDVQATAQLGGPVHVTVQWGGNNGVPTGFVAVREGTTTLQALTLTGTTSSAQFDVTLPPGQHTLTGTYSGNRTYSSRTDTASVNVPFLPTSTQLTVAPAESTVGDTVTLRAVVTALYGSGAPTGNVRFDAGPEQLTVALQPTPGLLAATQYGLPASIRSLAVGDFTGDGVPELVTGSDTGTLRVLKKSADGFSYAVTGTFSLTSAIRAIEVADLDRDGKLDIAAAANGRVYSMRGKGDGTFFPAVSLSMIPVVTDLALGDRDGNGVLDVLVAGTDFSNVPQLARAVGDGAGNFATVSTLNNGATPGDIAYVDLNGDNRADPVVLYPGTANGFFGGTTGHLDVYFTIPAGGWSTATTLDTGGNPGAMTIADVDGDGRADLVVSNLDGTLGVLRGTATGLASPVTTAVGATATAMRAADIDQDGDLDLAVVSDQGAVGVIENRGGTFGIATLGDGNFSTVAGLRIAGMTGDGKPDVIVAASTSSTFSVYPGGQAMGATTSTTHLMVGNNGIRANYLGDAQFAASASDVTTHVVSPRTVPITVTTTPNPSALGQSVTVTADLTGVPAADEGSLFVGFFDNTPKSLGSAIVSHGRATVTTTQLSGGTSTVSAQLFGNDDYEGTGQTTHLASKAASTLTLTPSLSPSVAFQEVTFIARVAPTAGFAFSSIGGTVTFSTGATTLATVPVKLGVAEFTTSLLTPGTRTIQASFSGDRSLDASSASITHTVQSGDSTCDINTSPNPSPRSAPVTVTVVCAASYTPPSIAVSGTPIAGGTIFPVATVTFRSGGGVLMKSGTAAANALSTNAGAFGVTAQGGGNPLVEHATYETYSQKVTTLNDSGAGSLRQAIADAPSGGLIGFNVTGQITLFSPITINKSVRIVGPGSALLTINGNNSTRHFYISGSNTISLSGMTLTAGLAKGGDGGPGYGGGGGGAGLGGSMYVDGASVSLLDIRFTSNRAIGGNGGGSVGTGDFWGTGGGGGMGSAGVPGGVNQCGGNGGSGGILGGTAGAPGACGGGVGGNGGPGAGGGGSSGDGGFGGGGAGGIAGNGGFGGGGGGEGLPVNGSGGVPGTGGQYGGHGGLRGNSSTCVFGICSASEPYHGGAGGGGAALGGALFVASGGVTITNSTFSGNTATGGNAGAASGSVPVMPDRGQGLGGAVFALPAGMLSASNVIATNNTSTDAGNGCAAGICGFASLTLAIQGTAVAGVGQMTPVKTAFPIALRVFDGVPHVGSMTFKLPANGPSGTFPDGSLEATVLDPENDGIFVAPTITANDKVGSFQVTVSTSFDPTHDSITLTNLPQTGSTATTTAIESLTPSPSQFGWPPAFRVTIGGATNPGGRFALLDGFRYLGTWDLPQFSNDNVAQPWVGTGMRGVRAIYQGGTTLAASRSTEWWHTVLPRSSRNFGAETTIATTYQPTSLVMSPLRSLLPEIIMTASDGVRIRASMALSTPTEFFAIAGGARAVGVGEFSGDTLRDLVVLSGNQQLQILRQQQGTFVTGPSYTAGGAQRLAVGDIDLDGYPDVITVGALNGVGFLQTWFGIPGGGLSASTRVSLGGQVTDVRAIAIGDFNSDGRADVAVADWTSGVYLVLDDGFGGFLSPRQVVIGGGTSALEVADFNRDGLDDLVVAGSTPRVFRGPVVSGVGTVVPITDPYVLVVDVNGDGFEDVVSASPNQFSIQVRLGDGTGALTTPGQGWPGMPGTIVLGGLLGGPIGAADLNSDGVVDLVVAHPQDNKLGSLLGEFAKASQSITFETPSTTFPANASISLGATASSGLPVTYTVVSGAGTISGTTLTPTTTGAVLVRASQAGNADYDPATPVNVTFVFVKAPSTITFPPIPTHTLGDPPFALAATSNSGLPVTFQVQGPATLNGNVLTLTGAGQVLLAASVAGSDLYEPAETYQFFDVVGGPQIITFPAIADKTFGAAPFALSASSSCFLPVTLSILSGPATIAGGVVSITGTGAVTVRASQAGGYYCLAATPVDRTFNVAKANQTIAFGALPNKTYLDAPFALGATATSSLPVSFAIVSGPATLAGNTLTITAAGTVTVRASQAGNGNYNAATPVDQSFTVGKANQTIAFGALANRTYLDAPFALGATATSNLPVAFSIVSGPATLAGNTLTIAGAGAVTVRATQAGDGNYNAAPPVDQTFAVAKANQTIAFGPLAGKTYLDAAFALNAAASSNLAVSFAVVSGPATLAGDTLTITGAGTVTVRATQAGDDNYNAASPVDQTFAVAKANQTIAFGPLAGKTYLDAPFALNATASSNLAVSFAVISGPATLSGNTLTITGAGTVTVRATQTGDSNYHAATPVDQSFTVDKANQTIAFAALQNRTYLDAPFALGATATSNLPVAFSIVSGPATLAGNTLTITAAGTVTVRASQAGNGNYNAATPVDQSFTVGKANQTITFGPLAGKTYLDAPFALNAAASSNLDVSFAVVSGPAMLAGDTLTITGAGTVTVRATQTGDSNYHAATPVDQSFTVDKANQTIAFAALPNRTYLDAPFALGATATSNLPVAFSIVSGPATLAGNTLTITGAGAVTVRATQAGDGNYNAAPPVDQTFTVAKADQTITFDPLADVTYGAAPVTLTASSFSGGAVTFSVAGPASLSGATVTILAAGTVTVTATQAGDGNYNAAPPVIRTFTVARAALSVHADSFSRVYGTPDPVFTGIVTGVVNGDAFSVNYSTTAVTRSSIGGYPIAPAITGPQLASYDVSLVNGTLTITKAPLGVVVANAARSYWDPAPAYGGTMTGVVPGDNVTAAYSSIAGATSPAGTYAIVATLVDPDGRLSNYTLTNVPATLTISNPVPVIGALSPASVAAGSADTWIDIAGQDFVPQSVARWDGTVLDTQFVSRTLLRARIPAARLTTQTVAYVTVISSQPGGGTTLPAAFFVNASGAPVDDVETASATNGVATASVGGNGPGTPGSVTVTAQGSGTITTAQYNGNPGTPTAFRSAGEYFDVFVAPGSAWTTLSVVTCRLNGGNNVFWYDGARWIRVNPQSYSAVTGCVTMTFSATSTPTIAQLTGSYFSVAIDFTAPVTTATGTTTAGSYAFGSWTDKAVTVALSAADNPDGVGLQALRYSASGAMTVADTVDSDGQATIAVAADGDTTVRFTAVDQSGNEEAAGTRLVRLDRVAPVATLSADPSEIWPPNNKMVPVTITGRITDDRSGIQAASYRVADEYGTVQPAGSLALRADGTFTVTLMLEAARKGTDKDGRQYVITINAVDRAGNPISASTTVMVAHNQ